MTPEQEAVVRDALEQAGLSQEQVARAMRAARLEPTEVAQRLRTLATARRLAGAEVSDGQADLTTYDAEKAHVHADWIILEVIGEPAITEAFRALPKWYA